MMTSIQQFEAFIQEYNAWQNRTQVLPFRRDRNMATLAFELELDHMIDSLEPILSAAVKRSTQFDYARVAGTYLHDLDQIKALLESTALADLHRRVYLDYLAECRNLLLKLGLLPVPPEGHLGFRGSALQTFRFMIDEYGFNVVETSPISVRYETETMFTDVSHSPLCPMNSVLVGKRADDETSTSGFILDDFAYAAGLGVLFDYERFDLLDSAGIAKFLQTAASLTRDQGNSLLSGDAEAFRDFQRKADERERLYIEMMERQSLTQH